MLTTRTLSSIRTWITVIVLVPLVSLAGLWSFITVSTYGEARELQEGNQFQEKSLLPTQRLVGALQAERRLSLGRLAGNREATAVALAEQRRTTDRAVTELERHASDKGMRAAAGPLVLDRIQGLVGGLRGLGTIRDGVDARTSGTGRVLTEYSRVIDAAFAIYSAVTPEDAEVAVTAKVLVAMARAHEYLSREDALLGGAAGGGLSQAERAMFTRLVGSQRNTYADNSGGLTARQRTDFRALTATPEFATIRRIEEQVMRGADVTHKARGAPSGNGGARPGGQGEQGRGEQGRGQNQAGKVKPVRLDEWRAAVDTTSNRLYKFENSAIVELTDRATGIAMDVVQRLAVAAGVGLLVIALSVLIAMRLARRLLRECRTLAAGVVEFTRTTLPRLAEQAREGRPIDAITDVPAADFRVNEIRQISESFQRARDSVLFAAAREMAVRNGLSEVFVNLARRNQALLHRQLSLLDTMERRTEDPAELSDLFRLDHLATRMRRHAEGLVILAGKHAGRGWRRPVPLVDVIRGAVAEVEDYPRVRVQPMPRLALLGTAVADVIHLLAEIVENATTYSPPQSSVRVSGHAVANGFVIEVEDRGLGMTQEDLASANEKLADPPEFDPSDSARLGLFVVARLADRHGIAVTLRHSPYGGTTAIALIPSTLIVEADEPEPVGRRSTGEMAAVPAGAVPAGRGAGGGTRTTGPVRLVPEAPAPAPVPAPEPPAPTEPEPAPEAAPEPAPDPQPVRAQEPPVPPPAPPTVEGELPRRRRQTHIAPQLRERVDADLAAERGEEPDGSQDGSHSMLSAMQRGWERGRIEARQAEPEQPEAGQARAEEDDTT